MIWLKYLANIHLMALAIANGNIEVQLIIVLQKYYLIAKKC